MPADVIGGCLAFPGRVAAGGSQDLQLESLDPIARPLMERGACGDDPLAPCSLHSSESTSPELTFVCHEASMAQGKWKLRKCKQRGGGGTQKHR